MADETQAIDPNNNTAGISPAEMDLKGSNPIDPAEEALKSNDLPEQARINSGEAGQNPDATLDDDSEAEFDKEAAEFEKLLRDTIKDEIHAIAKEMKQSGRGSGNMDLQKQLHAWVTTGLDLL